MVWRKRKQQLAESGIESKEHRSEHLSTKAELVGGLAQNAAARSQAPLGAHSGPMPHNQDLLKGVWQADTREFCLPVSHSTSQRPFVIPRNYRISGSVSTNRQVVVYGEFAAGVLEAPTVTVAPAGMVRGRVSAKNVQISGTVDAVVQALEGVEVSGRGRLAGEIRAPAVKVWPGAALHASKLIVGKQQRSSEDN